MAEGSAGKMSHPVSGADASFPLLLSLTYRVVGFRSLFGLPHFRSRLRRMDRQDARYTVSSVGAPSTTATATSAAITRVEDQGNGNYTLSYEVTLAVQYGKSAISCGLWCPCEQDGGVVQQLRRNCIYHRSIKVLLFIVFLHFYFSFRQGNSMSAFLGDLYEGRLLIF